MAVGCADLDRKQIADTACPAAAHAPLTLRWIGRAELPVRVDGIAHPIGGISGMDRDPRSGIWYLLSDDRSAHAPARFYRAAIRFDGMQFLGVRLTGVVPLTQANGSVFPGSARDGEVPDPEALRVDPRGGDILWSSEGDRRHGLAPFVRRATTSGGFIAQMPLPESIASVQHPESGVRNNLGIEGLTFTPDGASLWVAMEGPLIEDGLPPSSTHGAFARFTHIDREGRVRGQYAYPLDPIPKPATGGERRADNGVSEILAVDGDTLLVVERSGYEVDWQAFRFAIRLYEARAASATDVAGVASLRHASFSPMHKRLVLDLDRAGIGAIGNIEAAAWGPRLPNGHRTLLLAADNNFHSSQANQFLAFEVAAPRAPCGPRGRPAEASSP